MCWFVYSEINSGSYSLLLAISLLVFFYDTTFLIKIGEVKCQKNSVTDSS